jgi:excinuclease UvrABC ATPase subunit
MVPVRAAREHNLKNMDVDIPRDSLVVFTGICGSGKSSLAFGTLHAEAQRRYLESVSPYARRLFHQMAVPEVDEIDGLAPAVALQQQRRSPTTRSSVGSVTTLSNLLRMLYSRAGHYPRGQPLLYAESFSPNTPEGACQGTFSSARRHVLHSFANTQSPLMKKRAPQYMLSRECSLCHGKRLRPQSLAVKFAGLDIADLSRLSLQALTGIFQPYADGSDARLKKLIVEHPEKAPVTQRIRQDLLARLEALLDRGGRSAGRRGTGNGPHRPLPGSLSGRDRQGMTVGKP